MVTTAPNIQFSSVIDEFFALKPMTGQHGSLLRQQVVKRAAELFANPDMRYMPTFKTLDLLAEMVNIASATAGETQLRATEASALLRANLSDNAPLVRQFILDAALERARYEPMMITGDPRQEIPHRDLALRKRWQAMLDAHQELEPLPADWAVTVTHAVNEVITAESFHSFRQGPLLQLFAEMLQTARHLHREGAPLEALEISIGPDAPLWKRYALKAARYTEKQTDSASSLPPESRIPGIPGSHAIN